MTKRNRPIVALVYDFDGTLSPGNMQEFGFIQAIGKKPQEFWQESDDIASGQDASNILSYMKLMFDEARKAGIKLRRENFKRFGDEIVLLGRHTDNTLTASVLCGVGVCLLALDVAGMAYGNYRSMLLNEVLKINLLSSLNELGATVISILILYLSKLGLKNIEHLVFVYKD